MALTQAQWYAKLKSWVPRYFLDNKEFVEAHFQALAKVLSSAQTSAETEAATTFIDNAVGSYLDLMGSERGITRISGESDDLYRERVRYLLNTTSFSTLYTLVAAALNNGTPYFIENRNYGFYDDDFFYGDPLSIWLDGSKHYNWFTLIIPLQEVDDPTSIWAAVVDILDKKKALGVTYDILAEGSGPLLTEDEEILTTEDGFAITQE